MFPFRYGSKIFQTCTSTSLNSVNGSQNVTQGLPWCFTSASQSTTSLISDEPWGFCIYNSSTDISKCSGKRCEGLTRVGGVRGLKGVVLGLLGLGLG